MSLFIQSIRFSGFRNYSQFELSHLENLTIFLGPNAVGKTNIVEAIQLLTSLTSLRNATADQLIPWDGEEAFIEVIEKGDNRELKVSLHIFENKKTYKINDKNKKVKEVRGLLPSVVFSPDDLCLVKGSQSIKRSAIDAIGVQLSANYQIIKKDYEKLLRHKNRLLKEEQSEALLQSVNELLVINGAQFQNYRYALFQKMVPLIKEHYQNITEQKEELVCSYVPYWEKSNPETCSDTPVSKNETQERFIQTLRAKKGEEKVRKTSLVGPHIDKIEFFIDGKNAGIYGSQGQQRSLVLAFKLAELGVIQEITQQNPVLLLDDVMSELDETRRTALLNHISADTQTFITTTTLEYFPQDIIKQATVVRLPLLPGKKTS
ncbi:MAG: DNA replication/repair protein RecF [Eggerthellaceae bacterium]|nr:DNA replication/repair protein RecF [Eggerthellaceae bacterium]